MLAQNASPPNAGSSGEALPTPKVAPTKPSAHPPTKPTPNGKGTNPAKPPPVRKTPLPHGSGGGNGAYQPDAPKEPNSQERDRLRGLDLQKLLARLGPDCVVKPANARDFIMASLYRNEYAFVRAIPEVVSSHPQFTAYALAALRMRTSHVPPAVRIEVRRRFARRLLESRDLQAFEALEIVALLGSKGYEDSATLAKYLRRLDHRVHGYLGRATVDALGRLGFRFDVREALAVHAEAGSWTRRALQRWVALPGVREPELLTEGSPGRRDPFFERLVRQSSSRSA